MELDAELLTALALIAVVVIALVWHSWFGPSDGSTSFFDSDDGDGGD